MTTQSTADIARYIDHTLLKANATRAQIEKLCDEARQYRFASVCVNPSYVRLCADLLPQKNSHDNSATSSCVKVCTVVGFPLGANTTAVKVFETQQAVQDGATEIDMVVNVGAIQSDDWDLVEQDIRAVVNQAHQGKALCKVILETCLLTDAETKRACEICRTVGADFVKTSTGFSAGGATVHHVALMRQTVGPTTMGVKASGGVRTLADAQRMIEAGATRIGASAGVTIVQEAAKGHATPAAATNESSGTAGY